MAADATLPDPQPAGLISHSAEEIARTLGMLASRGEPLRSDLAAGGLAFVSKLLWVDPGHAFIVLEASAIPSANESLLSRPRASFRSMTEGLHIEFAASAPTASKYEGRPAIRLRFPDVMATKQRRANERLALQPHVPLHVVVDEGGVISFDGYMIDISEGGIGFVQYAHSITLEPGTILRGCRIDLPGRAPVQVDLEVRYSVPVALPGGRQALRSGCRFVDPGPEAKALLGAFFRS